jgi:hypothetical protein
MFQRTTTGSFTSKKSNIIDIKKTKRKFKSMFTPILDSKFLLCDFQDLEYRIYASLTKKKKGSHV